MRKEKLKWDVLSVTYEIVIPEDDYLILWKYDSILDYEDTIGAKIANKYKVNEVYYSPHFGNVILFTANIAINTIALREDIVADVEDYIEKIKVGHDK